MNIQNPLASNMATINPQDVWTTGPSNVVSSNSTIPQTPVKGKLLVSQLALSDAHLNALTPDIIKGRLKNLMCEELLKADDIIQFTQQYDNITQQKIFRSYLYVVNSQNVYLHNIGKRTPITTKQLGDLWSNLRPNQTIPSGFLAIAKMVEEFHGIK